MGEPVLGVDVGDLPHVAVGLVNGRVLHLAAQRDECDLTHVKPSRCTPQWRFWQDGRGRGAQLRPLRHAAHAGERQLNSYLTH